ncbi:hypothetical protein IG631_22463 [Alternaria alternata]|nr:hypothetical protein IG631_22463 [Alternaria alternata]
MAPTTASSTGEPGGRFDKVADGDKQDYPHLIHCPHGCQKAPVTLHEWLGGPLPASTERRSQFSLVSKAQDVPQMMPLPHPLSHAAACPRRTVGPMTADCRCDSLCALLPATVTRRLYPLYPSKDAMAFIWTANMMPVFPSCVLMLGHSAALGLDNGRDWLKSIP